MDYSLFNNDLLNFRLLPTDVDQIDDSMMEDFESILSKRDQSITVSDLLTGGIRFNPDRNESKYLCVICNEKLNTNVEMHFHVDKAHIYPEDLLRKTEIKPVVGLSEIIEYRNVEDNKIVEYKCTLCDLFINEKHIFWHVISLPHKENFFATKYSDDFVQQIEDVKLKHEKIDQTLINYEKSENNGDRGRFQRRFFKNGMIDGNTPRNPLNMQYIRRLYPAEETRLKNIFTNRFPMFGRCRNWCTIKINSEEDFKKGKEIIQKMNWNLLEYANLM